MNNNKSAEEEEEPRVEEEPDVNLAKKGAPVTRQVHILNEGIIIPFILSWMEMVMNFLLLPVACIFVWIVQPLGSLLLATINFYSKMKLKSGSRKVTKVEGHESFWMARTKDEKFKDHLKFANVVIITLKGDYSAKDLKSLLLTKVVMALESSTNKRLHPRFSQKLSVLSCGRAWVEDTEFDIENHIVEYTDEILSSSQLMQLASESASLPFLADRPRWRIYFVPNYPSQMSTMVFSCDPAMADGVYLLHVLHTSIVDEPPKDFARRHYGAFNQELDSVRSIFGGITWFFKNFLTFKDRLEVFATGETVSPSLQTSNDPDIDAIHEEENLPGADQKSISRESTSSMYVLNPSTPFPTPTQDKPLPRRKFLVFGPISLDKLDKVMDVTKASVDELVLSVLTASLRNYFHHIHGYSNPFDMAANVSVALQAIPLPENFGTIEEEVSENKNAATFQREAESQSPAGDVWTGARSTRKPKKHSQSFNISVPGTSQSHGSSSEPSTIVPMSRHYLSPHDIHRSGDKNRKPSADEPKGTFQKPRSFSVGVVPQTTSVQRAFHSQVHANFSNNAESQMYAKTIEVPSKRPMGRPEIEDVYSTNECARLKFKPKLSTMKIYLPTSVEGVLPSLWHIKNRIVERKTESGHISFYMASQFFSKFLPSRLHRKLMNHFYGRSSLEYHGLIGSKTRLTLEGNQIRNIFFWGPLRREESIGVSCFAYMNNVTITLNVHKDLNSPELIFEFFTKKMEDMRELLQYRRIKQQPRMDTILVPYANRRLSWQEGVVDDDIGEEMELRLNRSNRFRASFSNMRRSSLAVLNSLMGPTRTRGPPDARFKA